MEAMRYTEIADTDCAIAQALGVVGDWWTLLVVRDVAGGLHRFDDLQHELGVSRKVLAERLASLVEHGVLDKVQYEQHPPRFEYHLSRAGQGLMPVLIALQEWGTRWVMGDGTLTATAVPGTVEAARVRGLVGTRVPPLTLTDSAGALRDPIGAAELTVLYCYPGAYADSASYPVGWGDIPGARGCTLESVTYRDRLPDFAERGAEVVGVSTQRPDEQAAFAAKERIRFALVSDQDLRLAGALRLPTFRAAGADRLKRATLVVRHDREIRGVLYPVTDPAGSVDEALALVDKARGRARRRP
jgi:DNA-binding HxlR family transcriptional regulator/peroxiredoxin